MDSLDYSVLDNILIEDYDLILKKYSVVHKFCLKNNITTLGTLVRMYDNNELKIINKKTKEEFYGFMDLIKYRHFGIMLPYDSILLDSIIVKLDTWKGNYKKGWNEAYFISNSTIFPLKRLGFSTSENDKLKFYVEEYGKSMLIIDAIIKYRNDPEKKVIRGYKDAQKIFEKKLDIIIDYYNKNYVPNVGLMRSNKSELEKLLYKYKSISEEIKILKQELSSVEEKIITTRLYVGEDKLKQLLKAYNIDDIN